MAGLKSYYLSLDSFYYIGKTIFNFSLFGYTYLVIAFLIFLNANFVTVITYWIISTCIPLAIPRRLKTKSFTSLLIIISTVITIYGIFMILKIPSFDGEESDANIQSQLLIAITLIGFGTKLGKNTQLPPRNLDGDTIGLVMYLIGKYCVFGLLAYYNHSSFDAFKYFSGISMLPISISGFLFLVHCLISNFGDKKHI